MSARDNILRRIREANGRQESDGAAASDSVAARLRTHGRGPLPTMEWDTVQRFKERCAAMASTVGEAASLAQVPQAVATYLRGKNLPTSGSCWPEFANLDWAAAGLSIQARPANGDDKLGITGAYCALAENGTLMLLSGEKMPATTSLLPENHVAIVPVSRIVPTMEDAWDLLRREGTGIPRQINFISGPSRTADIEMTLVLGAHGPFRVHVILVQN